MTDTAAESPEAATPPAKPAKKTWRESLAENIRFLITLAVLALILRSIVAPFSIPSGSMLPRLLVGDYLFVAKWPYGWSRHSFPLSPPLFEGRVFGGAPARGDVVVFKTPSDNSTDYIKRVIGLPGDLVQVQGGVLSLNGTAVPKVRIADFVEPVTPNSPCPEALDVRQEAAADGSATCRYPRFRETLPEGKSYEVLDFGMGTPGDDTRVFVVPAGHYFLMGDNRDNSLDSRFPPEVGRGIGLVPEENLVGRALVTFFSTDGSAAWIKPWTWFTAARWSRIGKGF